MGLLHAEQDGHYKLLKPDRQEGAVVSGVKIGGLKPVSLSSYGEAMRR